MRRGSARTSIPDSLSQPSTLNDNMAPAYELRNDSRTKKQSMADLKLRRLNELNMRLREDLDRPRIKVSEASMRLAITVSFWSGTND